MLLRLHQQSLLQPLSPVIRERPTPFPPSMPTELVTLRQLLKSRPHVIQQGTHSLQALLEDTQLLLCKSPHCECLVHTFSLVWGSWSPAH